MIQTRNRTKIFLHNHSIYDGPLILVNKHYPIQRPIESSALVPINPGIQMEKRATFLYQMVMQKSQAYAQVVPVSGYRSKQEQVAILKDTISKEGEEYAYTYVALPDCSEHQTGLAIDVAKKRK